VDRASGPKPETETAVQDERVFIHEIRAASHELVRVNEAWVDFAIENGCPDLTRDRIIGRNLFDLITGEEVRQLYMAILHSVEVRPRAVTLDYRCDAPDRRRFLRMSIEPGSQGTVRFLNRILREEVRVPVPLLAPQARRSQELLGICSVCKCVRCDDSWLEVEEAVNAMNLFNQDALPQLTHSLCPRCYAVARAEIG
jgi:hypothetical protein